MNQFIKFGQQLGQQLGSKNGPYRDRVEIFAISPYGRILGGRWINDRTFGIPGGGVDPGEDALQAALRELYEETGFEGTDPRFIPGLETTNQWSLKHRQTLPEDRRHFVGTRTRYVLADLLSEQPKDTSKLDYWGVLNRDFYDPSAALALHTEPGLVPQSQEHWEARKKILESLTRKS